MQSNLKNSEPHGSRPPSCSPEWESRKAPEQTPALRPACAASCGTCREKPHPNLNIWMGVHRPTSWLPPDDAEYAAAKSQSEVAAHIRWAGRHTLMNGHTAGELFETQGDAHRPVKDVSRPVPSYSESPCTPWQSPAWNRPPATCRATRHQCISLGISYDLSYLLFPCLTPATCRGTKHGQCMSLEISCLLCSIREHNICHICQFHVWH